MNHQDDEGKWKPEKDCLCQQCWYYGIGWKDAMIAYNQFIFAKETSHIIKDMMEHNEKEPYSSDEIVETMMQSLKRVYDGKVDKR